MLQNAIERIQERFAVTLTSATDWALAAGILVAAAVVALLPHTALLWLGRRLTGERRPFLRTVLAATKGPTRLGLLLIALAIALPTTPLASETVSVLARLLALATICLIGWAALTALHIGADSISGVFGSTSRTTSWRASTLRRFACWNGFSRW